MLTLIILGISLLLSIILIVLGKHFWCDACEYIGVAILSCAIVCFVTVACFSIDRKNYFKYQIEEYENVKMQVEAYNRDTTTIENITLRQSVLDENNMVSKNKVFSKSKWVGPWYSEEIGNLEKLEMRKK